MFIDPKTSTLDQYFKRNGNIAIDIIKMDTEGTEHLILEHSATVLSKIKPIIICETLFNAIEADLEKIMKSYGYQFYNHIGAGLKQVDTIIREDDDGIRNCFFVHPDKFHLITEFVV